MVNYNLFLVVLGQLYVKIFVFLYQDEEVKQAFTPTPFVSFYSIRTLKSHLVQTKVYLVRERLARIRKSKKKYCQVYKMLEKLTHFNLLLLRRFLKSVVDLPMMINFWPTFCRVRYVLCKIMVKLITNSDTGGILIRIRIGKA